MIVATDNLSKEYDGVYRVQELDIRIKEGDIYGFLGPNGAGQVHHHENAARTCQTHQRNH